MADMLGEKSWYGEQEIEKSGYTAADQAAAGKSMSALLGIFGATG